MTEQQHGAAMVMEAPEVAPARMTGSQILCEALIREGVDTIFGYPGGAVLHIYDELGRRQDCIRHVLGRHEQGVLHMAEGYAKATGQVGVALVTSGPGATNSVTGIANAFMDSTPLVVITGQVPTRLIGKDAFQEIDTVGITRPCSKYNYLVKDVRDLAGVVKEAFHIARTGRPGPVVVDLPKDVSGASTEFVYPERLNMKAYKPGLEADPRLAARAALMIYQAQRPILYVGGGVIHSNAGDELLELAERLEIPVTTTLMGLGCFPSGHSLGLGMLGMHGGYWANMAISEADVIVAVGARFDDRVTGALESFAPHAEIIHIDVDSSQVSKNVRAHIPLVADAKSALRQILRALPGESSDPSDLARDRAMREWRRQIDEWKLHAPFSYERSESVIKPQHLIQELYNLTDGDAIITTDVGQHQMWLAQFYPFRGPRQSITSGGLGTMGFGFPAALGAQLAFPERQVVAFVGDGGFQMTAQELATAVQYKTNTKIIIMNNNFLGMVRQWQKLFYKGQYSSVSMDGSPDFVKLAEAYGAAGVRITSPQELHGGLKQALNTPGVVVIDVLVEEEENVYPIVAPGAGLKEMILG
ncbi:MAG TPA: biosynthetic-type acetolactate synthase large subunit [Blastocatellia bacterium]|nr:biosynthetic-type acetolactate synthase large subunit [Blastocatellia bacterium]